MVPQHLSVTWQNHHSALIEVLENFLGSKVLVDCTLAAEGQYLKAHKIILSACSPYFQMLFNQESEKNPIVILKDVKFQYLKLVVDFVYHGEVHVSGKQLDAFLDVAKSLQIKGLDAQSKENTPERTLPEPPKTNPNVHEPHNCKAGAEIIDNDIDSGVINKIDSVEENSVRQQSLVYEQCDAANGKSPVMVTIQSKYSMAPCESSAPAALVKNEEIEWPPCSISGASCTRVKIEQLTEDTEACSEILTDEEDFMGFDCVPIEPQAVIQSNGAESSNRSTTRNNQLHTMVPLSRMHRKKQKNQRESSQEAVVSSPIAPAAPTTEHSTVTLEASPRTIPECNSAPSRIFSNSSQKVAKPSLEISKAQQESSVVLSSKQPTGKTSHKARKYTKNHACPECHKQFVTPSLLATHRRRHTGERPYTCPVCKKSFTQSSHLKRHRVVHTGERPYLCKYCEKSFNTAEALKVHMRLHTGERPYQCGQCGRKFPSCSHLWSHRRSHMRYKYT